MADLVLLSRIQFAATIMFHYLFPPLTIGLGVVLVHLDGQWLRSGEAIYEQAARFWTRVFALNFALGVATGIVMEFEFGTNWATYSRFVGDVFGSALAAEGIFAFFLESGFLAVLVFGWDRVSPRLHFFSTCMVSLGAIFSSIWIVVANSWQQTPAGHHVVPVLRAGAPVLVGGAPLMRAEIVDFWAMVLNPSSVQRLVHVWIGSFILGAFFVTSVSAWYLLCGRHREFAERSFRGALVLATVSSLAMLLSGHLQARSVYHHQPAKLAAFEGHFRTGPADLSLFGIPDTQARTVRAELAIPGGLSFLLFDDVSRPVVGLDRFRPADWPPIGISFASYHLMTSLGFGFIGLTLLGCLQWWRGRLFESRGLLWIFVFAVGGAVAANEAGWVAAEVGRQPWIVHPPIAWHGSDLAVGADGLFHYDGTQGLRTAQAVSRVLTPGQLQASLAVFGLIYLLLFAVWIFLLNDRIQRGPEPVHEHGVPPRERFVGVATARPAHADSLTERAADRRRPTRRQPPDGKS
jgi:cytochrome bd ubiquinol oxidase subunit I